MHIDATQSEFKNFLKLITFTNRTQSPMANSFCISKGYLWRRDEHRLCAFQLSSPASSASYEYSIAELEMHFPSATSISMGDSGMLHLVDTSQEQAWMPAAPSSFSNIPLDALSSSSMIHQVEYAIPANFLSKQLSIFQTKIRKAERSVDDVELVLNFNERLMYISSHEHEKVELPLEAVQGHFPSSILHFSFSHFKDFLANANKFNESIIFRTHFPYFTVIILSEHVHTILMHKKE